MGRIEKIEHERRTLGKNDREVMLICINSLKEEKKKTNPQSVADALASLRAKNQQAKETKNT